VIPVRWLRVSVLCLRTRVALPTVGVFACGNGAILLRLVRVVLFQMYCGLGGLDWRTPWNVLPYGCASPDR